MPNVKVHIQFPEDKIKEPVIYQIGHELKSSPMSGEPMFAKPPGGWISN